MCVCIRGSGGIFIKNVSCLALYIVAVGLNRSELLSRLDDLFFRMALHIYKAHETMLNTKLRSQTTGIKSVIKFSFTIDSVHLCENGGVSEENSLKTKE